MSDAGYIDFGAIERDLLRVDCGITCLASREKIIETVRTLRPYNVGLELMRIGGNADGGYLVPNDLDGIKHCFSPGVSVIANFELDLANKYNIKSFMIDGNVEESPIDNSLFEFEEKFLSSEKKENNISLQDWVDEKVGLTSEEDLILQMDIEGGEFDTIISTPESVFNKFRIMVIEFHMMHYVMYDLNQILFASMFRKLTKNHTVVHLHPNNYSEPHEIYDLKISPILEVTLLRNDRFTKRVPCETFPNPLDQKNVEESRDFPLSDMWYK